MLIKFEVLKKIYHKSTQVPLYCTQLVINFDVLYNVFLLEALPNNVVPYSSTFLYK